MVYEWIVVGGGIQGCTIAAFLLKNNKVSADQLLIIDPHETPLYRWTKTTKMIEMKFLRSPSVHHLDVEPFSLRKYADDQNRKKSDFYGVYKRPSLELFNEHSQALFRNLNMESCWHQGFVNEVVREDASWTINTVAGNRFKTKNVVLALSVNGQLNIPEWASNLEAHSHQLFHIYDEAADLTKLKPSIAVVGGGITAAHLVIKLSAMYPGQVHLIKRHPYRVCDFDSDPGWLGPKNQKSYQLIKDYETRREMIKTARNRGSLPQELFRKLKKLEQDQILKVIDGEIISARNGSNHDLILTTENGPVEVQSVILATGFKPERPGGGWLEETIEEYSLPCAKCGYPIVSPSLEWCPHLYVIGPLAELEMGPIARNISGARQAAERIVLSV
ncbi:FAD/NAD(P)-binding protein [Cytobacillus gottheilii]|uniref:FAD/NAD(P)-binding protein n=1 Tax=Cytobacillus gottheilii TaxID=859144 RepID=UPI0009BBE042|nr:FAD/NAD(P)-binding protein [Cytobacillus gottheilii]